MGAREIAKNAEAIATYLEMVWHLAERSGGVPETPMNRKERGQSRAPTSDDAVDLLWANRETTSKLRPILRELKASDVRFGGFHFSDLLTQVDDDPEAVRRFRDSRSRGYPGHEGRRARAFFRMCLLAAYALRERHDGPGGPCELYVVTSTSRAKRIIEASEDPRRYRPDIRRFTAHDSYRLIVEQLEEMVAAGYDKGEAKKAKAKELCCSVGRISDAISFVNRERPTLFDGPTGGRAA